MAIPGMNAANAYASVARLGNSATGLEQAVGPATADSNGPNFGAVLREIANTVIEAGRTSDAQTQAMAAGKANIVDVVTAVAETETAITALVSVRDKVIQSYQEIMRMPI